MKKTKRILSLILVITMILSLTTTVLGTVTIGEIPLRVKEKADAVGTNITIFTDSAGTFEIVAIDNYIVENDMLTLDKATNTVTTDYVGGDDISSYATQDNGETWVLMYNDYPTVVTLSDTDFDIVYSDNDVYDFETVDVLYNSLTDNIVPFQSPSNLANYVTALNSVNQADYTTDSWSTYQGILLANAVSKYNTQVEVNIATNNVYAAQGNLVLKTTEANLIDYNNTLEAVRSIDFTPNSWADYQIVVNANIVTLSNTQEEVDSATEALAEAQTHLVLKLVEADMTAYEEALAEVKEEDYEPESWSYYQVVVSENKVTSADTQNEVDEATQNIINAQKFLILKSSLPDLTAYHATLAAVVQEDYTSSSWSIYMGVVGENVVTQSNTQEEVNTATQNIINAQKNLVFYNKINLDNAKFRFSELVETDYETDSWALLTDILQLDESTNADIGIKYNQMMYLMDTLIELSGDLTEYSAVLDSVKTEDYTTESWEVYESIAKDTMNIVTTYNLQSEIDAATERIREAQNNLVPISIVDKTELNLWKEAIATYIQADYTVDSWNALQMALNEPENTVEEVALKVTELQEKINGLVFTNQAFLDNLMSERSYYLGFAFMFTNESFNVLLETGDLPESTKEQVDIKIQAVTNALIGLVELSAHANLNAYNNVLNSVHESDYTPNSWAEYKLVVNANIVTINNTQKQVDDATVNIVVAQDSLVERADFTEYSNLLASVARIDYTEESWLPYKELIDGFGWTPNTIQSEVDAVIDDMILAQSKLVQKPADLTEYYLTLNSVKEELFTTESWLAFKNIVDSNPVDTSMKQSEVIVITYNIGNARSLLIIRPVTDGLITVNYEEALANVNEIDYTLESWAEYQLVVDENWISVVSTQDEVDEATANILEAQETILVLRKNEVDLTGYNSVLGRVNEEDYTAQSWLVYLYALSQNEVDEENSQIEVDEAVEAIREAQDNLILKTDFTEFNDLPELDPDDYTEESWAIYEEVWADIYISIDSTQEEVDEAIILITEAQKNLVLKTNLTLYIEALDKVKQSNYTNSSWKVYQEVVAENVVTIEDTQTDVDLAVINILEAQKSLVEKSSGGGGSSGGGSSGGDKEEPVKPVEPVEPVKPVEDSKKIDVIVDGKKSTVVIKENIDIKPEIKGYVSGYSDNTFRPENKVTRAETTQMLSNILGDSGMLKEDAEDVDSSAWYSNSVGKIMGLGVMGGYSDGTFRPDSNITRQEFAVTLVNLMDLSSMTIVADKSFTDVENTYGAEAIKLLASIGVISGYPDGTFGPDREITRAEMVVILNRLLGDRLSLEAFGDFEFTDIEDSWAKDEILRAAGR